MPQKSSARNKKRSRKEARDLDVKISFLEGIVGRDPQYVERQILGDHYTQRGKFGDSLKVDKRLSPGTATLWSFIILPAAITQPRTRPRRRRWKKPCHLVTATSTGWRRICVRSQGPSTGASKTRSED
jgi:hypothetical protein